MGMRDREIEREERAIYAIVALAGAPLVFAASVEGTMLDTGSTIGILLMSTGLVGLVWRYLACDPSLPRARALRSRRPRQDPSAGATGAAPRSR